jgi:hypothetical protein
MWFVNRSDEGVIHGRYFEPLPVEIIALILTAMSVLGQSRIDVATDSRDLAD